MIHPAQVQQTITGGIPVTAGTTVTVSPAATHIPAATITSSPAVSKTPRLFGEYGWVEYRNNITQTLPPNPRFQREIATKIEHSFGSYNGSQALHEKITQTFDYSTLINHQLVTTKNGDVAITDRFFNISTGKLLGGSISETINGVAQPEVVFSSGEYLRDETPTSTTGIMPFGEMTITLTDLGAEPVTVPSGTYPSAEKYTGTFHDGTPITLWIASGIPVPVQFRFSNRHLDGEDPVQTFELIRWG
ncbi:MAG: hypothetical protein WC362_06130 [Methanoregula sp.]